MSITPTGHALRTVAGAASAAGCIAFGAAALRAPEPMAERCGLDVDSIRIMALRDLAVGALLLARPSRTGFVARAGIDAGDTLLLARRRPMMAAIAAAYSALNAVIAAAYRPDTT